MSNSVPSPERNGGRRGLRRAGTVLTVAGALALAAGLLLFSYNRYEDMRAGQESDAVLSQLRADISDARKVSDGGADDVKGVKYAGYLEIPSLGLELPVRSEWSYDGLTVSPCRYSGSAATGDLVIAAHNYDAHFGRIGQLSKGDRVAYTDARAIKHRYRVDAVETIGPLQVTDMTDSKWELTLFTCNYDGSSRVAVRCFDEAVKDHDRKKKDPVTVLPLSKLEPM